MSDPVIESQEIKETQEFPSIQNVEGGEDGFQLVPKYQTKVKLISNNSV